MTGEIKTEKLVMTALFICMIIVTTMFFKIPIPFANGYVHLGDAMIFLAVLILGVRRGAIASAVGSALGDVFGGFAIWAPWTFVIKGVMALIMGFFISALMKTGAGKKQIHGSFIQIAGMFMAGAWMTLGYFIAEWIIYNWMMAIIGIPWNIGQFVVGMVIAFATAVSLNKTPAAKYFTYHIEAH